MKKSAGILLYRVEDDGLKVLIVHPGSKKKENINSPWSIPKGIIDKGESVIEAAVRELWEETGLDVDASKLKSLGSSVYKSKKKEVFAFTTEFTEDEVPKPASWEVDQIELVDVDTARDMLHEGHRIFIDRLKRHLKKELK